MRPVRFRKREAIPLSDLGELVFRFGGKSTEIIGDVYHVRLLTLGGFNPTAGRTRTAIKLLAARIYARRLRDAAHMLDEWANEHEGEVG